MENSVWTGTLAGFREKAGGTEPVPAGVSISAVTASLALALVAKVLQIAGNPRAALLDGARAESARLAQLADEDILAFNRYMECRRLPDAREQAMQNAITVPMDAARAAVRGLEICAEAIGLVRGLTAADIGSAAALLAGAVRAMLISVDLNVRLMRPDPEFSDAATAERRNLELQAVRHSDAVTAALPR